MKQRFILGVLSINLLLAGCETKAGSGALGGAAVGTVIGGVAGGGQGALIGAGAGAVGGAIIGSALDESDRRRMNRETRSRYDNDDQLSIQNIIDLSKAKISADKIIGMIKKTRSVYPHLSTKDIDRMRNHDVHEKVINYMIRS